MDTDQRTWDAQVIRSKSVVPEFGRQFLGIIESVESPMLEENHGGGDDRAGERSSTGLIDAGDENDALLLKSAFVPE